MGILVVEIPGRSCCSVQIISGLVQQLSEIVVCRSAFECNVAEFYQNNQEVLLTCSYSSLGKCSKAC